jgi:hypothetical protein
MIEPEVTLSHSLDISPVGMEGMLMVHIGGYRETNATGI